MNNRLFFSRRIAVPCLAAALSGALYSEAYAQNLADGLVSYWPLDVVVGGKTPDLVSGYDFAPYVGASHTLGTAANIVLVPGVRSNAVSFVAGNQTILAYPAGASDELPINKHEAFTISFWANGAPGQSDLRLFSEGNLANNNPLFNLGSNSGTPASLDVFLRQVPTQAEIDAGFGNFGTVGHLVSTGTAFDNTWHHLVFVQQTDGSRSLYIDGVLDEITGLTAKPAGNWNLNATSLGGILRSTAAAWITASIDDVALWKRALSEAEINEVKTNGLTSVFNPLASDLVSHWPLDVVVGGKTPDVVSGYDLAPYVGASHTLGTAANIVLVPGVRSNAVSFVAANQTILAYPAGASDELPINKHEALTISFWANGAPGQSDLRLFSEGNLANNNPLFNLGSNSGTPASLDVFIRQVPTQAEIDAGFGNFGTVGHLVSTGTAFDNTWHHLVFVQQADGTRSLYIDGVLDEITGLTAKPAGNWNLSATSIGGILRSTAAAWITASIDDVALWKRALSEAEINEVKISGVPNTFTHKLPLQIKNFVADRTTVGQGETVVLKWEASADATISIGPGIGSVMGVTQFGVGSTGVVVNATTTFTLTASRGTESTNAQVTVNSVGGVAAGWHLIEKFDTLTTGHIGGQGNWQNALGSISGPQNPANVVEAGTNKIFGFDGSRVLAATALNSISIPEGASNTLFFRFYISPDIETPSPVDGTIPDVDINFGLTEKGLRDSDDFRGGNNGPSIRIIRSSGGAGGPIDLTAPNGVGNALGEYSYLADSEHNPTGEGLQTGVVYKVWMDVENRPFDVVAGVQNGGDLYSLYIQREGDATRTNLFQGLLSDRDAVNIDSVLGAPTPDLTELYFDVNNLVAPQGTNTVLLDDFFLSASGFNSGTPVPASSFVPGSTPVEIRLSAVSYNFGTTSLALSWSAEAGKTYTVEKRASLSSGNWATVVASYPNGGATAGTVSFTDTSATGATGFYRISSP